MHRTVTGLSRAAGRPEVSSRAVPLTILTVSCIIARPNPGNVVPELHETCLDLLQAAIAARPAAVLPMAAPPALADGVLIGLIGRGIQLSRSPAMHEREAARLGLRCAYILAAFDRFGLAAAALPALLSAGAAAGRSEERGGGKGWVSTCNVRG